MNVTRTLIAAAMVLAAPALAMADPNLKPDFDTKTGTVAAINTGASDAGASLLTISCAGLGGAVCPDPNPADLAPYMNAAHPNAASVKMKAVPAGTKEEHTIPFYKTLPFAPGSYIFTVCVDADNDVVESSEGDNCSRIRHTVKPKKATLKLKTTR